MGDEQAAEAAVDAPQIYNDEDIQPPTRESWDDFWAEVSGKAETEVIRGVTVPVPTDLPMVFERRAAELESSQRDEDVQELVSMLFGPGVLDQWLDAGMGLVEFQTVVAWGMANGRGAKLTFREAHAIVMKKVAEAGKAPAGNRAERRSASKRSSASTGGPSKRISKGSTGSARTKSQR